MSQQFPHVAIIGGGPGGLCLAQGLKKAGISVRLYERDLIRNDYLQGFRLSLRTIGVQALEQCLPPHLFDAFLATSSKLQGSVAFLDKTLKPLDGGTGPAKDDFQQEYSASRITLRQILKNGLDDVVELEKSFERYSEDADGRITAYFSDGSELRCDVLIGADGASSRVRGQLLSGSGWFDTGARRIAGKIPLDDVSASLFPAEFENRTTIVKGSLGNNLFLVAYPGSKRIAQDGIGGNDEAIVSHGGLLFDNTQGYIMWALSARSEDLPSDVHLKALDRPGLFSLAKQMTGDWHPVLRALIERTDVSTLGILPIRSSHPVKPWATGSVTLMGDAIHSMTYFRGQGATTALHDAGVLCQALIDVTAGKKPLVEALALYEREMLQTGFEAVRQSFEACERALGLDSTKFPVAALADRAPA